MCVGIDNDTKKKFQKLSDQNMFIRFQTWLCLFLFNVIRIRNSSQSWLFGSKLISWRIRTPPPSLLTVEWILVELNTSVADPCFSLPDPHSYPLVTSTDPLQILPSSSQKVWKTSLKNDVNVPVFRIRIRVRIRRISMFSSGSVYKCHGYATLLNTVQVVSPI